MTTSINHCFHFVLQYFVALRCLMYYVMCCANVMGTRHVKCVNYITTDANQAKLNQMQVISK